MRFACVLTAAVVCGLSHADRITLAAGGKPSATIVVAEKAAPRLLAAAQTLQEYVRQISGAQLPIRTDGKRVAGTGLYVGGCEPSLPGDVPAADLNPETYAIHVRDGNVFFSGRWPTPVHFAVTSFLEDSLGVRWFAPGPLWEWVPRSETGDLVVEVADKVSVPGFSPRIWSGHQWTDEWQAWDLRNKAVQSEVVPRRQFQNNLFRVFAPSKYAETHPEYYPLVGGKRYIPAEGDVYWRPCEGNPEVQRLTVEAAREYFARNPNTDSFSLGMDDISHLCSCPLCRAMDPAPDSYEKKEFSDRHYKFVNAVAREIAKTNPDRYIGTLIYSIARKPPVTVEKLEDNVFGYITQTCGLWYVPGRQAEDEAVTREWARRCKHLSRYDYIGFGTMTPRVFPHSLAAAMKLDHSLGFEGMYTEVYAFLPNTAPMLWAMAKLQWDPTLELDALLGEFYAKMYGTAAPVMKEYFDLLERSYSTERPGHGRWEHRNLGVQATALAPEDLDRAFELLQKAANSTGDPDVQERVHIHRMGLQYGAYVIWANDVSQRLAAAQITDRASADAALRLAERLADLSAEREKCWKEALTWDGLAGDSVRGLTGKGYLMNGQMASVERGGVMATLKVLAWYDKNAPEEAARLAERLKAAGGGTVGSSIGGWLWVRENKPASVCVNGDFEDRGANEAAPEKDWSTTGAPKGWSTWSSLPTTRFPKVEGQGIGGSTAAGITGSQSGCYLQSVAVKGGEQYLCVAWVKPTADSKGATGRLGVRFQDEKGGWHARRDLEPSVQMSPGMADWQPLVLLATVPEGAARLIIMPGAQYQEPGDQVLFDDVALYKLQ
jgi:hypothetical protein